MLVRYKGPKPAGCPVKLPVGVKTLGEWARHGSKTVWLAPTAELKDADALKLVRLDPTNFELVVQEGVEADVHEGLVEAPTEACQALDGTEFAQAMAEEPAPKPKKKPGRKPKAKPVEAEAQ